MNLFLMFLFFSILGYVWEVLLYLVTEGCFINRGYFFGPWLPIYGSGAVLVIMLLKRYRQKPWLIFILSAGLCTALEYATAWYLETFRHAKWWNYSECLFNLHGRVCLYCFLLFGAAGCLIIYLLEPILLRLLERLPHRLKLTLCIIFAALFACDSLYSFLNPNTDGITAISPYLTTPH